MNVSDLESLEETLDILRDGDLVESLQKSQREAAETKLLHSRDHV